MDRNDVELHRNETLHDGFLRMVRLHLRHRLFAGHWGPPISREVVIHPGVAAVVPYDPVRDTIVLIEQFRSGKFAAGDQRPWNTEIVAGMIEDGESAEDMARREMLEETGCTLGRLEEALTFYSSPGGSSQRVALFVGEVSAERVGGIHGLDEEGEDIRVFSRPADDILTMIDSGEINNAISIVGLQWLARNREALRRRWT